MKQVVVDKKYPSLQMEQIFEVKFGDAAYIAQFGTVVTGEQIDPLRKNPGRHDEHELIPNPVAQFEIVI